jgi:dolichyl-phosphate-mannose-protein mannosyltransferase
MVTVTVTGSGGERSSATFDEVVDGDGPAAPGRHRLPGRRVSPPTPPGRIETWWGRLLRTPRRRALWYWGGPAIVTLVAAVLRLWNLGHPHAFVFDETYYV